MGVEPAVDESAKAGASATLDDAPPDGLTIEEYARKFELSEAEVWRRLRRGELVGRTQKGRLLIFLSPEAARVAGVDDAEEPLGVAFEDEHHDASPAEPDLSFLPPLPESEAARARHAGATAAGGYLALSGERTGTPEMALLLDHLSLAKEENREILRMTQESIRKVSQLSEALVEMKDTVIDAKTTEILLLKEQLESREKELRKLRQQNEDLEMLARTMVTDQQKP